LVFGLSLVPSIRLRSLRSPLNKTILSLAPEIPMPDPAP
jgi:hypothetical protein